MRRLAILAVALLALPMPALAADYAWPVLRVIDGDTIVVDASADLPPELAEVRVRLRGIDAPETGHRATCDAEREAGAIAKAAAEEFLGAALSVIVRDPEWDKWGGRVVADVIGDGKYSLADYVTFGAGPWRCGAAPTGAGVQDLVDELLAGLDREEADQAGGAVGFRAEIERHVTDPCIEVGLDEGMAPPEVRATYGDEGLARAVRAAAAPMIDQLSATLLPYVPHREPAFRMKVYDVFREICVMELRRDHRAAGGG